MAERAANGGSSVAAAEFANLFPEITAFTERLRFNVIYRGPQRFACAEMPLADIKAIRHKSETSINDVILALVTATIRRYCELHGDSVKKKLLRIMVPVNLRGNGSATELGNRISLVPVTIPLNICQPRRLLAAVHKRTEFLKARTCRRTSQPGRWIDRNVSDLHAGDRRTACEPVAHHTVQHGLHECARTAMPTLPEWPQAAAIAIPTFRSEARWRSIAPSSATTVPCTSDSVGMLRQRRI